VDQVSTVAGGNKGHARIFDALTVSVRGKMEVVPPQPIVLGRPNDSSLPEDSRTEMAVQMVVDSAGKVRSVEQTGGTPWPDTELKSAVAGWKFIPAFQQGRPVASRVGLVVAPKR
jgi:hypothetical protein